MTKTATSPEPVSNPTTAIDEIPALVDASRQTFEGGRSRPLSWRRQQLDALSRLITERETEICDALHADLGKPALEAFAAEVAIVGSDIEYIKKHLAGWMKPQKVSTPVLLQPASARVRQEPRGVVLIIAPWNYPFQLAMSPLVGAIAAGNVVIIKPSELAPATSALMARLFAEYLDTDCIKVVEGGVPETTALLEQRLDYVFFTGSTSVGKVVMRAAAEHLTPVTLELGGKSPVIVDKSANLEVSARRIIWGKCYNAGQSCVAPDYALVHEDIHERFVEQLKKTILEFYGDDAQKSPDLGRIINERHHARVAKLLEGQTVAIGGQVDEADCYIAPTVLVDVDLASPVMNEEIFAPILAVIKVADMNEAVRIVNDRPEPLALYVFAGDSSTAQSVLDSTRSGGAAVNQVLMHLAIPELPFGGLGPSGVGAYHGKHSFDTFTHRRGVLNKPTMMDPPIAYPPYTPTKEKIIRRFV